MAQSCFRNSPRHNGRGKHYNRVVAKLLHCDDRAYVNVEIVFLVDGVKRLPLGSSATTYLMSTLNVSFKDNSQYWYETLL